MNIATVFCDWCCTEGPTRTRQMIDPTNPLPPREGNGWELRLCAECQRPLDRQLFSEFAARYELDVGVSVIERRAATRGAKRP